jgi:hypothetical protein
MNSVLTLMTLAAGLLFSFSCAVLIEELVVGSFFRLFFATRPVENSREKNY